MSNLLYPNCGLRLALGLVGVLAAASPMPASAAERLDATPKPLEDVGIEEHLDRQIPLDVALTTADGEAIKLHEIIRGSRPVLLTLNYADCPMLCNLQLDGLVDALRQVSLEPGKDFDIITLSINPNEDRAKTRAWRDKYVALYERPQAKTGWHFVTGSPDSISRMAQATGFRYTYVTQEKEYAHTAAFMLLSPEGRITRYIYGVMFEPRDLRLALVEAAEGKVGSTLDRILLYCFHYDAATGRYAPMAQNIMRLGGAVTLALLVLALIILWRREAARNRRPMAP